MSRSTIRDYEGSRHDVHRATGAQIRRAFEEGGVLFLDVAGCGLGLCLKALPSAEASPDLA